jgi:acetamidase/formamidase
MSNEKTIGSVWTFGVISVLFFLLSFTTCTSSKPADSEEETPTSRVQPQYFLGTDDTHNRFSSLIPPALEVPSGSVIEVQTKEGSDGQFTADSVAEDVSKLDFEPIHPLTGPIYVEAAEPGDVLAVTLHKIEVGDWAWTAIVPGFGFLADDFPDPYLKTFRIENGAN